MNELELQRLVDGELADGERAQMLRRLDSRPTDWRRVALALLEEQGFQREIGRQSSSSIPVGTAEFGEHPSVDLVGRVSSIETESNVRRKRTGVSMALAASLLVGLGFAGGNWLANRFDGSLSSGSSAVGPSIASRQNEIRSSTEESNRSAEHQFVDPRLKPVGQLQFTSDVASADEASSWQLPMYEAAPEQIHQMLRSQMEQVQQWNEQLRRRGLELDWRPEMIESRLPDGRSVIVPIHQVNLRTLGQ